MSRKIKKYGWTPDLSDHRDHLYAAPQPVPAKLPKKVDLRPNCPPIFNQDELGSCTANAIAAAHEFDQMKQNKPKVFTPSRLFIYCNEHEIRQYKIRGTVNQDSGAMIRDGIKSLVKQGAAPESACPYDRQVSHDDCTRHLHLLTSHTMIGETYAIHWRCRYKMASHPWR